MDDKNRTGLGDSRLPEDDPARGPTAVLLDFLIARHPGLYSVDELVRLFSSSSNMTTGSVSSWEEGVRALVADGLVHQLGRFVWASHAASAANGACGRDRRAHGRGGNS
jgi:hypothetical protein